MVILLLIAFVLAPAYVIKFSFLHLPTDILMLWVIFVWIAFLVWLVYKKQFSKYLEFRRTINKKVLIFTGLFFLSGIISLFIKGIDRAKLGQFIVLFLQPISLFFIARYVFSLNPKTKTHLLLTTYFLLAISGLYGIIQYFTLLGLPPAWWGNSVEPKRALSFFVHPNFYALWCAPLLALLIPDLLERVKRIGLRVKWPIVGWLIGAIGLLLSLSRSGWLGLAAAVLVYLIFAADKKIRKIIFGAIVAIIIIVFAVPNLRWRVILPFYGEKSAVSRISLWRDGLSGVKDAPILGLGLNGFAKDYGYLNTDPNLDTHNFPHNIFLDLWVETGLIGLISLIGLITYYIYTGLKNRRDIFALGVALFLIAIIFQGLVDNPYFKNDLALVFWIVLALI